MKRFIAVAAILAAHWQPAHPQTIVGSIPEKFQGDWCWQENTDGEQVFRLLDVDPEVWTHIHIPSSSAPLPTIRLSPASSSMPRSKGRCAARPELIATGFPRCGPGMATPSTFMSASLVRRTVPNASLSPRRTTAMAVVPKLDFWFTESTLHPSPPLFPPKPKPELTLAGLPPACNQIVKAP
jgi:hypothetical protein